MERTLTNQTMLEIGSGIAQLAELQRGIVQAGNGKAFFDASARIRFNAKVSNALRKNSIAIDAALKPFKDANSPDADREKEVSVNLCLISEQDLNLDANNIPIDLLWMIRDLLEEPKEAQK